MTPIDPEGNFVVVWESLYSDGADTDWSVQAQRFASRPVMVDSFESGDLSAWSSIVQQPTSSFIGNSLPSYPREGAEAAQKVWDRIEKI